MTHNAINSMQYLANFLHSSFLPMDTSVLRALGIKGAIENNIVPFGYSDLGYSGCAAYSNLNPPNRPLSLHK